MDNFSNRDWQEMGTILSHERNVVRLELHIEGFFLPHLDENM